MKFNLLNYKKNIELKSVTEQGNISQRGRNSSREQHKGVVVGQLVLLGVAVDAAAHVREEEPLAAVGRVAQPSAHVDRAVAEEAARALLPVVVEVHLLGALLSWSLWNYLVC